EGFAGELLAVKDSLEAAMVADNASIESLRNGVELTLKQLTNAFGKFNVKELNPLGEKFDPHRHQAIGMLESEQDANTVVSVLQKGYLLNDRVLRPAMVMVAQSKA
ncbi:MAG TPA: nucleotide exchange factor GrpE, partial [Thiobacillaceae bacterium]|nr:nucleotide exchange factor GrpE [Thiobacillaceae bacterium]